MTLYEKLKNWVNKTPFPSLLSFFITKDGKINPTWEESKKDAKPASGNWARLGLDKISPIGITYWQVIAFPVAIWGIAVGSNFIVFVIENIFAVVTVFLGTSLAQNSLIILGLGSVKNALIFLFGTLSKFVALILFGWMLYKIYKSWGRK